MDKKNKYNAIVIGVSAGGFKTMPLIINGLKKNFLLPILIVQHIGADSGQNAYLSKLSSVCDLIVKQADDKEEIKPGYIYLAPPDYHLLIEKNKTLSLNIDEKVHYSRPSIDVLFETAAHAYQDKLLAIILTGASVDGTNGAKVIKKYGGSIIVQNPDEAISSIMPASVINNVDVDKILIIKKINKFLCDLFSEK